MLSDEDKQWLAASFVTKADLRNFPTKDDLRDMETSLLTAFHQWATPSDKRVRSLAEAVSALELEIPNLHTLALEIISLRQRVEKLEGGR